MLDCRAQEHEIAGHAIFSMGKVRSMLQAIGGQREWGGMAVTGEQVTSALNQIATACQARPVDDAITLAGRVWRMTDAAWWKRNLRREITRENEKIEHSAGAIRRKSQVYVSDHAVKVKGERAKVNAATLDGLEVMNEEGEVFNLGEVVGKSVSNPRIRRAELMMRCRGFEETAAFMGHGAEFLTITCPSRFHRFDGAGQDNKKWTGATPKDAQEYLCKVWAKIRASWKRQGFTPYGFRVAEPHHDGCPHWHILLFMPAEHVEGIAATARKYAFEESPTERGAAEHRFTIKHIDPNEGSATGYIAKYICKNIDGEREDGERMGLDFASGKGAVEASARVRVWASTWGIRQFQQIGGPSVTVWRELRRLGEAEESLTGSQLDLFHGPQNAADRSMWALFWILQGGPEVPRAQLTLKPLYVTDTMGRYGEEVERIHGVTATSEGATYAMPTRLHTWTVQRAGLAAVNEHQQDHVDHLDRQKNIAAFLQAAGIPGIREFEQIGAAGLPWTGVNNCTEKVEKTGFDFSAFEPDLDEMPWTGTDRSGSLELQNEEIEESWKNYHQLNKSYAPSRLCQ